MGDGISVVITGGIGSGKSSVRGFLAEQGWQVLDGDRVGHEVLTDPGIVAQIRRTWPQVIVKGSVNRRSLGRIVFADHLELTRLEGLVHPEIRRRIETWLATTPGNRAVEISVLKLVDGGWGRVVVVDVLTDAQLDRSVRRGTSADEIRMRMAAQPGRDAWLQRANYVLPNHGSREELQNEVVRLADHLTHR